MPKRPRPLVGHPLDASLVLVPLTQGRFAVIDAIDADWVRLANWRVSAGWNTDYATNNAAGSLHRAVAARAGISTDGDVDHVNRNGLDCRRLNLIPASKSENGFNRDVPSNNTSGHKGITFHRRANKWQAQIVTRGRYTYLGLFASLDAALSAVSTARAVAHGEFSRQ